MQGKGDFLVGDYKVQPTHNKIRLNDQEFHVEPKIMQVLCYLVEHAQQVLSKQQILDALWPGQTIGQDVITRAIFELRKIFSDSAKSPKFISTISRKGYCFIHPVRYTETNNLTGEHVAMLPSRNRINAVFMVSGGFLLLAIIATLLAFSDKEELQQFDVETSLISHQSKGISSPVISPAGDRIVYVASNNNGYALTESTMGTQNTKPLHTSKTLLVSPVWLNEHEVIFAQCEGSECRTNQLHLTHNIVTEKGFQDKFIRRLSINTEKTQLLVESGAIGDRQFTLLNTNDYQPIDIPSFKGARLAVFDAELPLVYFLSYTDRGFITFNSYNVESGQHQTLDFKVDTVFSIAPKAKGQIWVSGRRDGQASIWLFDVGANEFHKVLDASPGEVFTELNYHLPTNQLAYKSVERNIDIGQVDAPFTIDNINSGMIDMNAVYLERREELVFASNRTGFYELWRSKQGAIEKITNLKTNVIDRPIYSPAQDKLAFTSATLNKSVLRVLNIENGEIELEHKMPKKAFLLSWDSDKNGLYYSAANEGSYTIYFFSFEQQSSTPVALNAGVLMHNTQNSERYFGNMLTANLMKETSDGSISAVYQLPFSAIPLSPHQATVIEKNFFYVDNSNVGRVVTQVEIDNPKPELVLNLPQSAFVTHIGKGEKPYAIYDLLVVDKQQLVLSTINGTLTE